MAFDRFIQLELRQQVTIAFMRGTYMMHRPTPSGKVMLYHLSDQGRGFFVELIHEAEQGRAVVRAVFSETIHLRPYLDAMQLQIVFN